MINLLEKALGRLVRESGAEAAVIWSRYSHPDEGVVLTTSPETLLRPGTPWPAGAEVASEATERDPAQLAALIPTTVRLALSAAPRAAHLFRLGQSQYLLLIYCGPGADDREIPAELRRLIIEEISYLAVVAEDSRFSRGEAERLRAIVEGLEVGLVTLDPGLGRASVNSAAAGLLNLAEGKHSASAFANAMSDLSARAINSGEIADSQRVLVHDHSAETQCVWLFSELPTHIRVVSTTTHQGGYDGRVWAFYDQSALSGALAETDRVSVLDGGQADVLEQMATGQPIAAVFRRIAALVLLVTGQHAVRVTTRSVTVTLPPGSDVSAPPVWRESFHAGGESAMGTLEVFGDSAMVDELDDLARAALHRCLDLASLELEREEARRSASKLAVAKSNYVATVSHEFRAPLHAILGFSELLENQLAAHAHTESAEWAGRVRTEAERLTRLIEDLLNLTRLDAGKMKMAPRGFHLRKMLDDLVQVCRVTTSTKGLHLDERVDPTISDWRSGDPDRLHQVLLNLISNATKFTREGGIDVEISSAATEAEPDLVRFAVTDTGRGIPADDIDRILRPFAQVSRTDADRGSGLGLAISTAIIKAMGGDGLHVASDEGHGSTFSFSLPLPASAAPEPQSRAAAEATAPDSAATILVVDDSQANQFLAEAQLTKLGYHYEAAFDGAEALERIASQRFDLVLMDCNMPVMDGFEATRRIRAAESSTGGHVPVLALTASTSDDNREVCERAGMDGFLTKPLLLADLARELRRFLSADEGHSRPSSVEATRAGINVTTAPLLDDARIDRLLEEIGAGPLHKVAGAFVAETPRRVEELQRAIEESDADAVRRSVHAIRSPSAMLGAAALADRLRTVEDSADPLSSVRDEDLTVLIDATLERLHAKMRHIVDPGSA